MSLNFSYSRLVCGALGRIRMRLTWATWCCWAKDRIQEETSHATWSRCASVWKIFLWFFEYSIPCDSPLALFWRGSWCISLFFLCSLIGAQLFFFFYDPSLLLQDIWGETLWTFGSIYFWVDGRHVLRNSQCESQHVYVVCTWSRS